MASPTWPKENTSSLHFEPEARKPRIGIVHGFLASGLNLFGLFRLRH